MSSPLHSHQELAVLGGNAFLIIVWTPIRTVKAYTLRRAIALNEAHLQMKVGKRNIWGSSPPPSALRGQSGAAAAPGRHRCLSQIASASLMHISMHCQSNGLSGVRGPEGPQSGLLTACPQVWGVSQAPLPRLGG